MPTKTNIRKAQKIYNKLMLQSSAMSPAMIEQLRLLYTLLTGQVEDTDKSLIDRIMQGEEPRDLVNEITTSSISLGRKIPKPMGTVKRTRKKDKEEN